MTYPQPGYPQAHQMAHGGYPAQPGYAPQGVPQQYAPAPQYGAPAAPANIGQGIPTPPPPMPQLHDGGSSGGAASPKMRHLVNRTIIVIPKRIDDSKINTEQGSQNYGKPQPEAYFDLVVVDGGPLRYGDNQSRDPSKQRPNTHEIDTPCVFRGANDYGFGFVQAVREALDSGEAGRVGVVQQGTRGNFPYLITKCGVDVEGNARPDGDARFAAAMELFGKLWRDQHAAPNAPREFVNPTPRSLVAPGPQAQAAPAVNYGQPPAPQYAAPQVPAQAQPYGYAAAQYAATGTVPTPYGNAPATDVHPAYAAAATGGAYPPGYGQYPTPAAPAPAAQLPPQVEAWLATLDPATAAQQRELYLTNAAQQPQGAPAAPAGPGM